MQQSALKRSTKIEFNNNNNNNNNGNNTGHTGGLLRDRSFIKQGNNVQKQKRSQTMTTMTTIKPINNNNNNVLNKPTMELYRPPNVRSDIPQMGTIGPMAMGYLGNHGNHGNGKLNVHAKEFTMNHHHHHHMLQQSKSSGNVHHFFFQQDHHQYPLQQHHSKSGMRLPLIVPSMPVPLMHSSTSIIVPNTQHNRVSFNNQQMSMSPLNPLMVPMGGCLKRSKSMIETHHSKNKLNFLQKNNEIDIDLSIFPDPERKTISTSLLDPNCLPSRTLMDIVKVILESAVECISNAEIGAKLCMKIIEKENSQTFLESLLNTCQQWYQERDRILRGIKSGDGTRFTAFMWFLTEMCTHSRRHEMLFDELKADDQLLTLLCKCCIACVALPIKCLAETECLFLVLTSIGRVLEMEQPSDLEMLMASVRDAFLANAGSAGVRRILLQLIELHASNWQLPGSSVLYYYPRIK